MRTQVRRKQKRTRTLLACLLCYPLMRSNLQDSPKKRQQRYQVPCSEKVLGSTPCHGCRVCMFDLCLSGLSPDSCCLILFLIHINRWTSVTK
ncbi:hypothetical protein AMECASPLE_015515 [Ameca splendens]|uniref:Secreted protein n=1 Tax=Ameca splendens TaxID=208324 RepID=A0ABV0XF46_9TELE